MRLAKVFEPFWQEGNAFLAENTGVGLGLSIAKSYVEAQGGRIELKPAREHGTIFRIAMPLGAAAVAEPAGADMPAAAALCPATLPVHGSGSEERREGKEGDSRCRYSGEPYL